MGGGQLAAQGTADDKERRNQPGDSHQHKEAAQGRVNLIAKHDGLHVRHGFRWGDNDTLINAFTEFVGLCEEAD